MSSISQATMQAVTGFVGRLKSDKGLLIRVVVGTLFLVTMLGLGFGLLVRTAVYQGHPRKFAMEAIGFGNPDFTETFPQVSIDQLKYLQIVHYLSWNTQHH